MTSLRKLYYAIKIMMLEAKKKHHEYDYIAKIVNTRR